MFYRFIKSPNYWVGRGTYKPEAVVIHITDGSKNSVINTFKNPSSNVSAHYLVTLGGSIIQLVKEEDTAWHVGRITRASWPLLRIGINPNLYTIGIEFEGFNGQRPTFLQAVIGAWLISRVCANWGIPIDTSHVIPHNWIRADKECPGGGISVGCLIWLAQSLEKNKEYG